MDEGRRLVLILYRRCSRDLVLFVVSNRAKSLIPERFSFSLFSELFLGNFRSSCLSPNLVSLVEGKCC